MALQDRSTLETFYETFDKPTQGQFKDFIDSAPNIVDDYNSSPLFPIAKKLPLSVAQIDNLFATPIDIVPAPGPNLIAWPLFCMADYTFVSSAWSGNTSPVLQHVGAGGGIMFSLNVLAGLNSLSRHFILLTPFGLTIDQYVPNAALQVTLGADAFGGDSTLQLNLIYTIYDIS